MAVFIGKIDLFDEAQEQWACYQERLDQYFLANGIDDDKKVASLLTLVGGKTYRVLRDLTHPDLPGTKVYNVLCNLLKQHYNPKPLVIAERFRFYKRDQKSDESVRDFNLSLRKLAEHCSFGDGLNDQLRDKLVCGLRNEAIQKKLLSERELTYTKAVDIALAMEAATRDVKELQDQRAPQNLAVNKLAWRNKPQNKLKQNPKQSKQTSTTKPCFRCNRTNHKPENCRFKDSKCHKCGKTGHIQPACRQVKAVHQLEEDEECLFKITDKENRRIIWVKPTVNGLGLNMELDTGSGVSVISRKDMERHFGKVKLRPTGLKLKTYSGETINPCGIMECQVTLGDQSCTLDIYVLEGDNCPLFGREWLRKLKLDWSQIKKLHVNNPAEKVEELKVKYSEVFSKELGRVKGMKANLKLKTEAKPKFVKHRPAPHALKPKIDKEIDRLVKDGVLEKANYSEWATPIVPVPKANGDIRICGDFKVTVNPQLEVEQYPLPRIEDIFMSVGQSEKFSKIDLKNAYLQLEVDDASKELLTISTHKGLFRYNRLPFGIASAPALFERLMEQIVGDIPGVQVLIDDILVSGKTEDENLNNVDQVLQRLQQHGLHVNEDKCEFLKDEVEFCGYKIDKNGLHKTEGKIEAVVNAPPITNVSELRSFLGLVQYYARFMPNLSTVLYPLHQLLKNSVKWKWTKECDDAVQQVKNLILSDTVLMNYNPDLPIVLACDASSYGLGAVLSHVTEDGQERPIAFASRTLNAAEKNYSQIDKEGLALVWGVKKFNSYLFGRKFTLLTDHKPLLSILSPRKGINATTAARLQRYALFGAGYTYEIQYKNTKSHENCDSLSRLPLATHESNGLDYTDVYYAEVIDNLPVKSAQIATATQKDTVLSQVYDLIFHGWTDQTKVSNELEVFWRRRNELSLHQGCIVWGMCVIIPSSLQKAVLQELHTGHLGLVKMKSVARSYVWWPSLDIDLETLTKSCVGCLQNKSAPPEAPIHPWEYPKKPWSRIHVDFAGPFLGYMYFVIVDAYSKWPVVKLMKSTTASHTVEVLRAVFADCGVCDELVSDNGPQFVSEEFGTFLKQNGVKHIRSAPYHPRTNGLAERFVQSLKMGLKAAKHDRGSVQTKLSKFLLQYRNAEHSTTKQTPAMLFVGRALPTRLDKLKPSLTNRVENEQSKQVRSTRDRNFEEGQSVTVRDYRASGEKWIPATIENRTGPVSYRVQVAPGTSWRRHTDQIRDSGISALPDRYIPEDIIVDKHFDLPSSLETPSVPYTSPSSTVRTDTNIVNNQNPGDASPECVIEQSKRRYPVRDRKKPVRLDL